MEIVGTKAILVTHEIKASECAQAARAFSRKLGYSEQRVGEAEIVAREIATNMTRHANGGTVVVQGFHNKNYASLEFFAWDRGPGIASIAEAIQDGYSTSGGLGHGLGSIQRLADCFAIDSAPGSGTIIYSQVLSKKLETANATQQFCNRNFVATGASIPKHGEKKNGDAWAIFEMETSTKILLVDGLGHGPKAATASQTAIDIASDNQNLDCGVILDRIHQGIAQTRGAVGAALEIDFKNKVLHYAGIGNIRAQIVTPTQRHNLVSHNGTLGKQIRSIQTFSHEWEDNSQLFMHSDGLSHRWDVDPHVRLGAKHPGLSVASLMCNHLKSSDDCTVVAARIKPF